MSWKPSQITLLSILIVLICGLLQKYTVEAIKCYQCTSSEDVHCTETIDVSNTNLKLSDCSTLHDAAFCVKTTGMYKGEVGTTRFCSSQDLGHICDFQQRMGDVRAYRSCFHTCNSDGCNSGHGLTPSVISLALFVIAVIISQRL